MITIETREPRDACECCGYATDAGSICTLCQVEGHEDPSEGDWEDYCTSVGCECAAAFTITKIGPRVLTAEEQPAYTYCHSCFQSIEDVLNLLEREELKG